MEFTTIFRSFAYYEALWRIARFVEERMACLVRVYRLMLDNQHNLQLPCRCFVVLN